MDPEPNTLQHAPINTPARISWKLVAFGALAGLITGTAAILAARLVGCVVAVMVSVVPLLFGSLIGRHARTSWLLLVYAVVFSLSGAVPLLALYVITWDPTDPFASLSLYLSFVHALICAACLFVLCLPTAFIAFSRR